MQGTFLIEGAMKSLRMIGLPGAQLNLAPGYVKQELQLPLITAPIVILYMFHGASVA